MSLRVVVAEDNYLVREGIRRLLEDGEDITVVGDAASAPELLKKTFDLKPDVVLTDIRMPPGHGMDGIEAATRIRSDLASTGVVVLSQHADAAYARALFKDGTAGLAYLLKERVGNRDELVAALTAVAGGGSVVDPRIVEALLGAQRHRVRSPLQLLSDREREVLAEMASGYTNRVIATRLHVSESAVSKHVASIFTKLGLGDDPGVDRRVRAVLAYITESGEHPDPG